MKTRTHAISLAELAQEIRTQELFDAIEKNNFEIIPALIREGADLAAKNKQGFTPIHYAALKKRWSSVLAIIKTNKKTDKKDSYGYGKACHLAAQAGMVNLCRMILILGSQDGTLTLHEDDYEPVIEKEFTVVGKIKIPVLIEDRQTIREKEVRKRNVTIFDAIDLNEVGIVKYFIDDSSDILNVKYGHNHLTPIEYALLRYQLDCLSIIILASKSIPQEIQNKCLNVFMQPCHYSLPVVKHLIERGEKIDTVNRRHISTIELAMTLEKRNFLDIMTCCITFIINNNNINKNLSKLLNAISSSSFYMDVCLLAIRKLQITMCDEAHLLLGDELIDIYDSLLTCYRALFKFDAEKINQMNLIDIDDNLRLNLEALLKDLNCDLDIIHLNKNAIEIDHIKQWIVIRNKMQNYIENIHAQLKCILQEMRDKPDWKGLIGGVEREIKCELYRPACVKQIINELDEMETEVTLVAFHLSGKIRSILDLLKDESENKAIHPETIKFCVEKLDRLFSIHFNDKPVQARIIKEKAMREQGERFVPVSTITTTTTIATTPPRVTDYVGTLYSRLTQSLTSQTAPEYRRDYPKVTMGKVF